MFFPTGNVSQRRHACWSESRTLSDLMPIAYQDLVAYISQHERNNHQRPEDMGSQIKLLYNYKAIFLLRALKSCADVHITVN